MSLYYWKRKKLSQTQLAELVDIHRTYISSIELGKVSVSFDILFKLADALDVPPSKLFEFRDWRNNTKVNRDNTEIVFCVRAFCTPPVTDAHSNDLALNFIKEKALWRLVVSDHRAFILTIRIKKNRNTLKIIENQNKYTLYQYWFPIMSMGYKKDIFAVFAYELEPSRLLV